MIRFPNPNITAVITRLPFLWLTLCGKNMLKARRSYCCRFYSRDIHVLIVLQCRKVHLVGKLSFNSWTSDAGSWGHLVSCPQERNLVQERHHGRCSAWRRGASTAQLKNVCVKSSSTRPGLGFILLTQLSKALEHSRQFSRYEYVCMYKYRLRSAIYLLYNPKNNVYVFKNINT